ncbi:MAG: hypothetical protein HFG31_06925 [Eubacterium sp.]|nr:hypothetical protein [Eubacterium sp.]
MNRKKIISIITIIALMITAVVPAFGAGGDGSGSANWPVNIGISNSSIETTNYKIGTSKEFKIGYYPNNVSGSSFKGIRHIEITGPAEVTDFQYSDDGDTWKAISTFESEIIINTSKEQKMKVTFQEAGLYTIHFWMTMGNEKLEISREFYVSDSGISRIPPVPADLKETNRKMRFEWSWGSDLSATFNFYIDGEKINDTPIITTRYNVSAYAERFTPGTHIVAVEAVHMLGSESLVSKKAELEYFVEEPTTEPQTTEVQTTEVQSTEVQTTEPQTTEVQSTELQTTEAQTTEVQSTEVQTTEPQTTEAQSTEAQTTEPQTTEVQSTEAQTTEPQTTEVQSTEAQTTEAQTTESPTTKVVSTTDRETTTQSAVTTKNIKLAKGKIKKAVKKATAKKVKITFKKIRKASSYQVQICVNKKFKKKNTITKRVKKTKCTIKRLKPYKKYYVRVRAMAKSGRRTVYGRWSNKTKIRLKK